MPEDLFAPSSAVVLVAGTHSGPALPDEHVRSARARAVKVNGLETALIWISYTAARSD